MFTARQVIEALKYKYRDQDRRAGNVTTDEVAGFLRELPVEELPADNDILAAVATQKPDWELSATDGAILSSVTEAMAGFDTSVDLEPEIKNRLRGTMAPLAAYLLENPTEPLDDDNVSILTLLDLLIESAVGWSADQGRAAQKFLDEIDSTISQLRQADCDIKALQAGLQGILEKDAARTAKLEQRLAASEAGKIRSKRSRALTAGMINHAMQGNSVTAGLLQFLKGPWYESMQLIAINHGIESDEWTRATKITQTLIWTYQPLENDEAKQRLYRIIEYLPEEVASLLLTMEHSGGAEELMAEIEEDHVMVVSGQSLDYVDWEPIPVEQTDEDSQQASVDKSLIKRVLALKPGQWFNYEDESRHMRIRLVLKLEDVRQLLFTNRNGMKALEKNFDDMAYLLTSEIVRPIEHQAVFSSSFRNFYGKAVEEYEEKIRMDEAAVRQSEADKAQRQRQNEEEKAAARAREEEQQRKRAEFKSGLLEAVAAEAAKPENSQKIEEVSRLVDRINVGAWLKLPSDVGDMVECKMAVKVASKMIFTDSSGERVADYTTEQLVAILVSAEGEILDAGVEFEDTLAQIVNKLRDDREKSYDDLTGSND